VRDIAHYLDIEVPDSAWERILDAISFKEMKAKADIYAPAGGMNWKGGADIFMNKGSNGRWREVLSEAELGQYDAAVARGLTPECAQWLARGGPA